MAVGLGALQGPTELLPVSSSAHLALAPWLLGSGYTRLDEDLRKSFEVALHSGTAAALGLALRDELARELRALDRRRLAVLIAASAPPAIAGYVLERPIEARLGTPAATAAALVAGGLAMALADRRPQRRAYAEARLGDGLALGIAQACALVPGISRGGATLAAARARGFRRADANRLSRHAAVPVIAGATALKGVRLWRRGIAPGAAGAMAAGACAAFASTLLSRGLIEQVERDRSLTPFAAYRIGLATAVVLRLRRGKIGSSR